MPLVTYQVTLKFLDQHVVALLFLLAISIWSGRSLHSFQHVSVHQRTNFPHQLGIPDGGTSSKDHSTHSTNNSDFIWPAMECPRYRGDDKNANSAFCKGVRVMS
ncbi:hypothetical protein EDB19DRAFT_1669757 [Suillus lakei]|nr:hypothetical protein EDB19DRAFT_1669757 [Suillus lakei]